jgi:hypothetical protein
VKGAAAARCSQGGGRSCRTQSKRELSFKPNFVCVAFKNTPTRTAGHSYAALSLLYAALLLSSLLHSFTFCPAPPPTLQAVKQALEEFPSPLHTLAEGGHTPGALQLLRWQICTRMCASYSCRARR